MQVIELQATKVQSIMELYPNTCLWPEVWLFCQCKREDPALPYHKTRGLIEFDLSTVSETIKYANLRLFCTGAVGNTSWGIAARKLTRENWLDSAATWIKYDGVNSWTAPGGDYDPGMGGYTYNFVVGQYYYFAVSDIVVEAQGGSKKVEIELCGTWWDGGYDWYTIIFQPTAGGGAEYAPTLMCVPDVPPEIHKVYDPTQIDSDTIKLWGYIDYDNGEDVEVRASYHKPGDAATVTDWQDGLHTGGVFTITIDGTDRDQDYYYALQARTDTHDGEWTPEYLFHTSIATPEVETDPANQITLRKAGLTGKATAVYNASIIERGFVWDTVSHDKPVGVSPEESEYANCWTEAGEFALEMFTHEISGLERNTTYYFRACVCDNYPEWGYGDELSFTTKDYIAAWEFEDYRLGNVVKVIDEDLGIDVWCRVTRITRDLFNPAKAHLELENIPGEVDIHKDERWEREKY